MRRKIFFTAYTCMLFFVAILLTGGNWNKSSDQEPIKRSLAQSTSSDAFNQHCTVFYAGDAQIALGGNNEDSFNPRTKIWFLPPEEGKYGVAIVGYEDYNPQGAVNDHGVFFDGLAVRVVDVPKEKGKPAYPSGANALMLKSLQECETLECVLKLFDRYSRGPGTWNGQYLVGDSTGDSAIIEPLAVIRKQGSYQVATNFFQSEVKPEDRRDARYNAALKMFEKGEKLSVDLFRRILDATHQEGRAHTLYSTIYDLKQGIIYLYFFHDFNHVVTLNLNEELSKGIHSYDIPSLFPPSEAALAYGNSISGQVARRQAELSGGTVTARLVTDYEGKYEFTPEDYLLIKSEGDKLFARGALIPWVEIYPESDTRFFRLLSDGDGNVGEIQMTFVRDLSGRVTSLEYTDPSGAKLVANKAEAQEIPYAGLGLFAGLLIVAVPAGWYMRRTWKRG